MLNTCLLCASNKLKTDSATSPFFRPVLIAESKRRPGYNEDGTVANDMRHGDYTQAQIEALSLMFRADRLGTIKAEALFATMRTMSTDLFARGALEGNIIRMIDHFKGNTGTTYSDERLTQAVRAHASTQRFVAQIRKGLTAAIPKKRGDVGKLVKNVDVRLIGRPVYSTTADTLDGLTIAINDTWSYDVSVVSYTLSGTAYTGQFNVVLYDHFGLDQPDVEKKYRFLAGFRAWFILQHLRRFSYKPFITRAEMTYDFEGSL